jgi:molybdate transport system substrate-binding protein
MRCLRWVVPCAALILALASAPRAGTVTVYAAASLTNVLKELGVNFTERTKVEVKFSFGNSATLAKQVERAAPADAFFSASAEWMDYLDKKGLIEKETRTDLLGNRLVIVALRDEGFRVEPRKGFDFPGAFRGRLALGDPASVPAGIYARQALQWLGWWDALKDRLAPGQDVRTTLAYVERGECAAGIVYATDARVSARVETLATLPEESHEKIVYPVAAVKGKATEDVRRFLAFLRSKDAQKTFWKHGFSTLLEGQRP